ncbi:MAG: Na(+)/H(+) antiporter subunit [Rickettsiales bacterium]|jgi:multicomponent Na+:H+ antiporter subunit D|nr:Na(+)/H(+) antiporter subunit [Rickettsiales bacterium]
MIELLINIGFTPAWILFLGAAILPLLPGYARHAIALTTPLLALYYIWQLPMNGEALQGLGAIKMHIAGFDIEPLAVHPYSHIFGTAFCLAAFIGVVFALNRLNALEIVAALFYAGGAIGVVFAGDLMALFLFWEIMAIASTLIIWSSPCAGAPKAGMRYALMHCVGGVFLLAGIAAHVSAGNGFALTPQLVLISDIVALFDGVSDLSSFPMASVAPWLMLIGILVNTAAPPFSAWLSDAYPESSVTGMVFLSAFTTKAAVFVLLLLYPGNPVLVYLGLFMVFYGIIYALLENDMRRLLAYSIINQVGFMVTGIGMGTQLSLSGAAAHAFCCVIYQALLLMSAGSVIDKTGKRRLSELGGLYQTMPVTMLCAIVGAITISAFPFTSGFISKSMISDAAHVPSREMVWYLLVAASAGVFLHAGIKFPWFVFFHRDSGLRPNDPPWNMQLAMLVFAMMCLIPGIFPQTVYFMLPGTINYDAYAGGHVVAQMQLLAFSGLAFFMMLPTLRRTRTISLDFDWFYRKPIAYMLLLIDRFAFFLKALVGQGVRLAFGEIVKGLTHTHRSKGFMARYWPIGVTVTWTTLIVGLSLLAYFLAQKSL